MTAGLLRVAGLPAASWLAGGNPELFALLRRLDEAEAAYRSAGVALADRLGTALVPRPELSGPARRTVLRVRRALHGGRPLAAAAVADVVAACAALAEPAATSLVGGLRAVQVLAARREALEAEVNAAIGREQERLATVPWIQLGRSAVGRAALAGESAYAFAELDAPRHSPARTDYVWRLVDRATTTATPRGWLGQVALVPIGAGGPLGLTGEVATDRRDSLHRDRSVLRAQLLAKPAPRVGLAPLHERIGDTLRCWDPDLHPAGGTAPAAGTDGSGNGPGIGEVTVRWTEPLAAICSGLAGGARTVTDLAGRLGTEPEPLAGLVDHLVGLGVLRLSPPISRSRTGWAAPEPVRGGPDRTASWLDVYRRVTGPLPTERARAYEDQVRLALRVLALVGLDADSGIVPALGTEPRPVLELLADRLRSPAHPGRRRAGGWPVPRDPSSGYARLLDRLETDAPSVELTAADLDELGAPADDLVEWPLDALLRIGGDGAAALDQVVPAGALDARFAAALTELHGPLPQLGTYAEFLRQVERACGVRLVELLVPPLSARAANAVRRPAYTRSWTGDPDCRAYWDAAGDAAGDAGYLPLTAITLRRVADRVVAEAGGTEVWPVYHATRSPLPPYDFLLPLLLSAGPGTLRWASRRLDGPPHPDRLRTPRLSVGGLVLTPARWLIAPADLPNPADPLAAARSLDALRRRRGLPRWLTLPGGVPCDLESLRAPAVLARGLARGGSVAESVPAPDRPGVPAPDGGHAAELLLRLPLGEPVERLVDRVVRRRAEMSRPLGPGGRGGARAGATVREGERS